MILNGHKIKNNGRLVEFLHKTCFRSATDQAEDAFADSVFRHTWTFDDCHRDLIEIDSRLARTGDIKFKFFVCPALIDDYSIGNEEFARSQLKDRFANLLNWDEIGRLKERGHSIGLHGHDHSDFNEMTQDEVIEQQENSIELLLQRSGVKTESFALPFGRLRSPSYSGSDMILSVSRRYFKRIYLSDNRFKPGKFNDLYNRRHSEFENAIPLNILKGLIASRL